MQSTGKTFLSPLEPADGARFRPKETDSPAEHSSPLDEIHNVCATDQQYTTGQLRWWDQRSIRPPFQAGGRSPSSIGGGFYSRKEYRSMDARGGILTGRTAST